MGQNFDSNFWPLLSGSAADSASGSRGTTSLIAFLRVLSQISVDQKYRCDRFLRGKRTFTSPKNYNFRKFCLIDIFWRGRNKNYQYFHIKRLEDLVTSSNLNRKIGNYDAEGVDLKFYLERKLIFPQSFPFNCSSSKATDLFFFNTVSTFALFISISY